MVERYREASRERYLTRDELVRLGETLETATTTGLPWRVTASEEKRKHLPRATLQASPVDPVIVDVIRFLLFSGARLGEALALEWEHVDFASGMVALPRSKGKDRAWFPVSRAALDILSARPRSAGTRWCFPRASNRTEHVTESVMHNAWERIRRHAGIEDVRLHDLRHTVGTFAGAAGGNAFLVRDLLRHANVSMTSVYANREDAGLRKLADATGDEIAASLAGKGSATVVPLPAPPRRKSPRGDG